MQEQVNWEPGASVAKFGLGELFIEDPVDRVCRENNVVVTDLLARHARGDFGHAPPHIEARNMRALEDAVEQIESRFSVGFETVRVITCGDRFVTIVDLYDPAHFEF